MNLILYSFKTILKHTNQTWKKISLNQLFYVSMGSFNEAEICKLLGLFLLSKTKKSKIFTVN